jgi:hypothetical protein
MKIEYKTSLLLLALGIGAVAFWSRSGNTPSNTAIGDSTKSPLLGNETPAKVISAPASSNASGEAKINLLAEMTRAQKQRESNQSKAREAYWVRAQKEVEQVYALPLTTIGLDKQKNEAVKSLLAQRILVPRDVREANDSFSGALSPLAGIMEHELGLVDTQIAQLVGDEKASQIQELIRLNSTLGWIQKDYAAGISDNATPLDGQQLVSLAKAFAEVQVKYQSVPPETLVQMGLVDGVTYMGNEVLVQAQEFLTAAQRVALHDMMAAKLKKSPVYNNLARIP